MLLVFHLSSSYLRHEKIRSWTSVNLVYSCYINRCLHYVVVVKSSQPALMVEPHLLMKTSAPVAATRPALPARPVMTAKQIR